MGHDHRTFRDGTLKAQDGTIGRTVWRAIRFSAVGCIACDPGCAPSSAAPSEAEQPAYTGRITRHSEKGRSVLESRFLTRTALRSNNCWLPSTRPQGISSENRPRLLPWRRRCETERLHGASVGSIQEPRAQPRPDLREAQCYQRRGDVQVCAVGAGTLRTTSRSSVAVPAATI
jgi:hypothetical protein